MSSKIDTEVIIAGKVFRLRGYESEEYLQKVASYINTKVMDYNKNDSFRRQPSDTKNILIQLNIADDYFKEKKKIETLELDIKNKERELYDLKHEVITTQIKMENSEKTIKKAQEEANDTMKKIIDLESKLMDRKKHK